VLTARLLSQLLAFPSVRIFHGIRPAEANRPRIPHAISAGRQVNSGRLRSLAPGKYTKLPTGQIYCDSRYIGQSVLPMISAVRHWRHTADRPQVTGLVIVHPTPDRALAPAPPAPPSADLFWARAHESVRDLSCRLPPGGQPVSLPVMSALVAATSEEEIR